MAAFSVGSAARKGFYRQAVLIAVVNFLGRILVMVPEGVLRVVSSVIGWLIYSLGGKRRHVALSNLYHAYPDRSEAWRVSVLRASCRQLVETALFVLASPQMSEQRLRRSFTLSEEMRVHWQKESRARGDRPGSVVALVQHTSLFEALALLPMLNDTPMPVGTVYRPLNQPAVEEWVLRTRQRFGMTMISRRQGLRATNKFLSEGGVVAVLFDQNAGHAGLLTTFYDRVCSTTELPGILAAHHNASVYMVWTEGTGFWRGTIRCEPLCKAPADPAELCFRSNQWLSNALRNNEVMCRQWLWLHDRWRTQDAPSQRLRLSHRRNGLEQERDWRELPAIPRGTHFWVRMPNWLGDVIMALPLLRALRRSRPDGYITLIAAAHFIPLLEAFGVADCCLPLPRKGQPGYWKTFRQWGGLYPHTQILFTNSQRGDMESWLIGAPQRFGISRKGKRRPLLTHSWPLPEALDEAAVHQTELWRRFLAHFGLEEAPDLSPLALQVPFAQEPVAWAASVDAAAASAKPAAVAAGSGSVQAAPSSAVVPFAGKVIGLVCGTENSPEKRWPVERWRALVGKLLEHGAICVLFGTRNDAAITSQVAQGFDAARVIDRAGQTDLLHYAHELLACDLLVTNDTGGMHLANSLGVPVLVVFGPTNPVRTGPVFDAPSCCLQPPGCPPQGGVPITGVSVDAVLAEAEGLLGGRQPAA